MPIKCKICKKHEASWAWQPLGPAEDADCFALLGSHARGFAVYKVCDSCRASIKKGTPFQVEYKGVTYAGNVDHVEAVAEALSSVAKWFAALRWCLPVGLEKLGLDMAAVCEAEIEVIPDFSAWCWVTVGNEMVMVHESEVQHA